MKAIDSIRLLVAIENADCTRLQLRAQKYLSITVYLRKFGGLIFC